MNFFNKKSIRRPKADIHKGNADLSQDDIDPSMQD